MASPPPELSTRVRRLAAFVGIVWALAASFVAFDLAALAGLGALLDTTGGRAFALPATIRESTTCLPPADAARAGAGMSDAPVSAWLLGVTSGMHAFISRWDDTGTSTGDAQVPQWRAIARQRSRRAEREIAQLAAHLQVPRPGRFTGQERADAHAAFTTAVETDAEGTARGIAGKYSEAACHLYKLGAYWGYAAELRMALPGHRSIFFGLAIEHHATRAGLPEELWRPVLAATPSNATGDELVDETQRVTAAITAHLRTADAHGR